MRYDSIRHRFSAESDEIARLNIVIYLKSKHWISIAKFKSGISNGWRGNRRSGIIRIAKNSPDSIVRTVPVACSPVSNGLAEIAIAEDIRECGRNEDNREEKKAQQNRHQ